MLEVTEQSRVIEMVNPITLKFAPFNPKVRTTTQSISKLKKEIEKAGKIIVPLVVTQDNYVADGHRRLSCALELNHELVPVIREDSTLSDLWSNLNGGNMAVNRKNWMQAVREGMPLDCVPASDKKVLSDLIRIIGRKAFNKFTDEGKGPSVVIVAQYVARYCGRDNDEFTKDVIFWMADCGTMRDAKTAVSTKCPPEVLISAIQEKRKIRQYWGMS